MSFFLFVRLESMLKYWMSLWMSSVQYSFTRGGIYTNFWSPGMITRYHVFRWPYAHSHWLIHVLQVKPSFPFSIEFNFLENYKNISFEMDPSSTALRPEPPKMCTSTYQCFPRLMFHNPIPYVGSPMLSSSITGSQSMTIHNTNTVTAM